MPSADETIRSLREALRVSPDNVPLRAHLAESLSGLGRLDEAEQEFRQALQFDPHSVSLKVQLARLYLQIGKDSQALVIVEDLVRKGTAPAAAHVLYAHLLLRAGDVPNAVAQYKLALENDPAAADEQLGRQLGVGREATPEPRSRAR